MSDKLVLVLACDLAGNGNRLGPRSIARLKGAAEFVGRTAGCVMCTAATYSPNFPKQHYPMSTLMADWLRKHNKLEVVDINGSGKFNTRGELAKFVAYADRVGATELVVASAWWHIPRVKYIFSQMFGAERAAAVSFISTAEDFTFRLRILEMAKRVHARFPDKLRNFVERAVRRARLNPSW